MNVIGKNVRPFQELLIFSLAQAAVAHLIERVSYIKAETWV